MPERRTTADDPLFFTTPADLRRWLEDHHDSATELWVGLHRKGSGHASITWPELVAQPPGYRKTATWWVISAKREETRQRRLRTLIEDSAAGLRIKELRR